METSKKLRDVSIQAMDSGYTIRTEAVYSKEDGDYIGLVKTYAVTDFKEATALALTLLEDLV